MAEQHVLGIDIGGTTTKMALVRAADEEESVIQQTVIDTLANDGAEQLVKRIAEAAQAMIKKSPEKISGVGVGCPGLIDARKGTVVVCANIPKLNRFPLRDQLSKALELPVEIQNDANATAVGEFLFGQGRDVANLIVLTLGTGVGGGVIADGHLVSGADNGAAELGHMKVEFGDNAASCGCGKFGCLEAYGGIAGIQRIAHRQLATGKTETALEIDQLTTKTITEAASDGDGLALATLFEVGTYLGRGIANLIETFNPEKVILSGGASAAFDFLLPGIKVTIRRHCSFNVTRDRAIIERSRIADAVGLLGPAAVFIERRGVLRRRRAGV